MDHCYVELLSKYYSPVCVTHLEFSKAWTKRRKEQTLFHVSIHQYVLSILNFPKREPNGEKNRHFFMSVFLISQCLSFFQSSTTNSRKKADSELSVVQHFRLYFKKNIWVFFFYVKNHLSFLFLTSKIVWVFFFTSVWVFFFLHFY